MPASPTGRLWAVIMAGGSGTRFWPESRKSKPKQFLSIFGKKTLLEETVDRLSNLIPKSRILVITSREHTGLVKKLLKLPASQIIGEPVGRNTAPCAVLAASLTYQKDKDAVIALLPADHRIGKVQLFRKSLETAHQLAAQENKPVVFGIKPAFAHTGYGYLEMGKKFCSRAGFSIHHLQAFHEKPNEKVAARYLKSGNYFWNSGMFVWKSASLLEASKKFLPDAYRLSEKMVEGNFAEEFSKWFPKMPNISIDYGLMEKLSGKILAIPVDIDWNDLGSWHSFAEIYPKDKNQNVVQGRCLMVDSTGNIVKSHKKLIALLGVEDHVVIDTEDALLVCHRSKTEAIRKIIAELQNKNLHKHL